MKKNLTEIIFILDKSGSMYSLTQDTIGGFNSFIREQRDSEGEALLTTVLFDDRYKVLHEGVNIAKVLELTDKDYYVGGTTALLDAIGKTINDVKGRLIKTPEKDRPTNVIFVITTDGQENSSREFTQSQIKEMIEHQTNKEGWQFLFLGANIDSVSTAESYGIRGQFACNYTASSDGTKNLYSSLSRGVSNFRSEGGVTMDWASDIY